MDVGDEASKPTPAPGDSGPDMPMGEMTIDARMENVIAHLDADDVPFPIFAARTEASS